VGRPDTLVQLALLARQTERIGLVATLNSTFNEPVELARQLATLDALSNGRAAWNIVTSHDAFFGANFRRGGYLEHADRYERARAFADAAFKLWDAAGTGSEVRHVDRFFDIAARPGAPATPQRSEEHTSELQSRENLVCRLLLEKKKSQTSTLHS